MAKINRDNTWVLHTEEVLKTINQELSSLQDAETGQRGFIITGLDTYLEPYQNGLKNCPAQLSLLKQLTADNPVQQQNCTRLETLVSQKFDVLKRAIDLRKSDGFEAARAVVLTDLGKRVMDDIRGILKSMIDEETRLYDMRMQSVALSEKKAKVPIYLSMILALISIIVLTIILTRIIAEPIKRMAVAADKIASGDLTDNIELTRKDEIGRLADSFRRMQGTLLEKTNQAREIARGNLLIDAEPLSDKDVMGLSFQNMIINLRTQLNNISEMVNVLSSSSSEIMASVAQLASSSSETATSVGETTITVEEVKQTAELSNQKAIAVAENAVKTADISAQGTKDIDNTIEGMNTIRLQMTAISGMVVKLSEQSQTIGEITSAVNELAEQSNILAVNAAIEAAKAGEQGKGFTVVAQEIKMLSDRSKEATSQIRTILRDIQKSISSAVMATEEGVKAVDQGLKLTALSGETIRALSKSISEAAKAAIQIAASSQQQLEGMDQVAVAMENIREASIQSAASTQQSVISINELQKVGLKLDEFMNQYKLVK